MSSQCLRLVRGVACAVASALLVGCAATPGREQPWGYVVSTAFSPDGTLVAATTNESEVALFDAAPLRFRRALTVASDKTAVPRGYPEVIGTPFRTLPLRFSPDGTLLASSSAAGQVLVWELASGAAKWRLPTNGRAADVVFLPDGQTLVTAGPAVFLWSMHDGARSAELALPAGTQATAAEVSPNGQVLLVGLSSGEIALFDASSRGLLRVLQAHAAPVTGLAFQPDGRAFASTAGGYDLRLWKSGSDNTFEPSAVPVTAPAAAGPAVERAQGAGLMLWLLGTLRGFQIAGAPTLGAPPIAGAAGPQFAQAAHRTPFHCGSRVAFSADGRYLASSANLMACPDCIGTLAPSFLLFVTELQTGATSTVRDLGCDVSLAPDGRTFATGGPGAPQLRTSATGQRAAQAKPGQ